VSLWFATGITARKAEAFFPDFPASGSRFSQE
jgi:hypothetical protein